MCLARHCTKASWLLICTVGLSLSFASGGMKHVRPTSVGVYVCPNFARSICFHCDWETRWQTSAGWVQVPRQFPIGFGDLGMVNCEIIVFSFIIIAFLDLSGDRYKASEVLGWIASFYTWPSTRSLRHPASCFVGSGYHGLMHICISTNVKFFETRIWLAAVVDIQGELKLHRTQSAILCNFGRVASSKVCVVFMLFRRWVFWTGNASTCNTSSFSLLRALAGLWQMFARFWPWPESTRPPTACCHR